MDVVGVIPARFGSTRLPGKPLLSESGRPLIQHVVEAARQSRRLARVIVATDDPRIADAVHRFGGEVAMTRADHASGTDRVAEVAAQLPNAQLIVNIQGDEPELSGETIDRLVSLLDEDQAAPMATLCAPILTDAIFDDPACVKVVRTDAGRAVYFSRSPIPYHRDGCPASGLLGFLHLGIYAYRRDFLMRLASMPPSPLEQTERLEQLRVLEAGYPIAIATVPHAVAGIDTPEDYRQFVARWKAAQAVNGAA